ncbi:MAG: DNA mismatch repair endonuclease MutL [Elusimicrobia bacterium]|nr:DNA mismatch repair endonuclease MutL [Elusimicrobiota bacterium]
MEETAVGKGLQEDGRIRRLPPDVASRIAAGEVIERPASVLKELLENALDAGARRIQVESREAGKKLLRVSDDGGGMAPADCRLAFERHATSKIGRLEDLERLATFGFRGEALFAIAAVSRASVTSCPKGSRSGWRVDLEGGRVTDEREAPPAPGTSIEVRDLFFNTPARAKFLKSDASEKSHLTRIIEEASLAHPEVGFAYTSEGRSGLRLAAHAADGGAASEAALRARAKEVLGEDLAAGMLWVSEDHPGLGVRALVTGADSMAATRSLQFWFLNRRPIASRLLQQALYRAYDAFRGRDRHPACVVWLEMPPDRFDVNVHPAKREVRFRGERAMFEAVSGSISAALLRSKGIPTVSRPSILAPDQVREAIAAYQSRAASASEPAEAAAPPPPRGETPALALGEAWTGAGSDRPRWYTPPFRFLGQIEQAYLVFDAAGGLLLVDQHAAQERILFERYRAELREGRVRTQPLMLPLPVELPASQVQGVLAQADRLKAAGFEVAAFGKTTVHVRAAPALFSRAGDLKELVYRMLDDLQTPASAATGVLRHALAAVACKAAVKAHDRLGAAESLKLLEDLKDCEDGTACPHGRPSMISLSRDELARRFRRPGAP